MRDRLKIIYLFVLLSSISIISIAGGLLALYSSTLENFPPNVYVGNFGVGGLAKKEAEKKLQDSCNSIVKDGFFSISYNTKDVKNEFRIMYSDIDAKVNYEPALDEISGRNDDKYLETLINCYFLGKKKLISPEVLFDKGKLVAKLNELATMIDRDPKDANIYLLDDKITKEPEEHGLKLNMENAAEKIKDEIGMHLNTPIEFKVENNFEITDIRPQMTLEKLRNIENVISSYTTEIKYPRFEKSIKLAAMAINKVWVPGRTINGKEPEEFSFNKLLSIANATDEQNNEGYNQVASTLFAAVLMAGIENSGISKTLGKTSKDYVGPGLDVIRVGNSDDFKFKNTLNEAIVIFASVKDGKLTVRLAGKEDKR